MVLRCTSIAVNISIPKKNLKTDFVPQRTSKRKINKIQSQQKERIKITGEVKYKIVKEQSKQNEILVL